MEKLSGTAISIARRLREYPGGLTAKDLDKTYIDVYPLIERKYVRVTSIYGVAIYVLTEEGLKWIENYQTQVKESRRKV